METLHGEVNKHVDKLQTQVSRLQAEVDAHTEQVCGDNLNCKGETSLVTVKQAYFLNFPELSCYPNK